MAWKAKSISFLHAACHLSLEVTCWPEETHGRRAWAAVSLDAGLPVWTVPAALKFVEDAVIFVQRTQLASKVLVDLNEITGWLESVMCEMWRVLAQRPHLVGLDGPAFHVQIPDLHRQVVSGHHVPTTMAEFHIGDGGNYF